MKIFNIIFLVIFLFPIHYCYADDFDEENTGFDDEFDDSLSDDVTDMVLGIKKQTSQSPASLTTITASEIKKMGATTLHEILERVPGMTVYSSTGDTVIAFSRGIYSLNSVIFKINGVVMRQQGLFSLGNNFGDAFGLLPINSIAKIEVIRGAGGILHGSDAIGAVVNIVTKTYDSHKGTEVGLRHGSFNKTEAWLSAGDKLGKTKSHISFEYFKTDGHDHLYDFGSQAATDLFFGTSLANTPGKINNRQEGYDVRLNFIHDDNLTFNFGSQNRSNMGDGLGFTNLSPETVMQSDRYWADIKYNFELTSHLNLSVFSSYYNTKTEVDNHFLLFKGDPRVPSGLISEFLFYESQNRNLLKMTYDGIKNHHMILGAGLDIEDLYRTEQTSNYFVSYQPNLRSSWSITPLSGVTSLTDSQFILIPENTRKITSFFFLDEWSILDNVTVYGGLRYEDISDIDTNDIVLPELSVVINNSLNLTTRLIYRETRRIPTMRDLYARPPLFSSNTLKPSKVRQSEIGLNYKTEKSTYDLSVFYTEWLGFLSIVNKEVPVENAGNDFLWGAELEANYKLTNNLDWLINFAWYDNTRNFVASVTAPDSILYTRLSLGSLNGFNASIQAKIIHGYHKQSFDTRLIENDDFKTLDGVIRYELGPAEIALIAHNITDEENHLPIAIDVINQGNVNASQDNIPLASRSVTLELRYDLK